MCSFNQFISEPFSQMTHYLRRNGFCSRYNLMKDLCYAKTCGGKCNISKMRKRVCSWAQLKNIKHICHLKSFLDEKRRYYQGIAILANI